MNDQNKLTDAQLEALFDAALEDAPAPSQSLWEQVLADADSQQPMAPGLVRAMPVKTGWLASLLAAIGGWPSLAGLATATLAGVWFGFTNPEALSESAVAALLPGAQEEVLFELEDFAPSLGGFAAMLEEG